MRLRIISRLAYPVKDLHRFELQLPKSPVSCAAGFSVSLSLSLSFTHNAHFLTHSKSSWQCCVEESFSKKA